MHATVANDWRQSRNGFKNLKIAATRLELYSALFGYSEMHLPHRQLRVLYEGNINVFKGNVLYPHQVQQPPLVTVPPLQSDSPRFYSLIFTDIDGHMKDTSKEVVHWMM